MQSVHETLGRVAITKEWYKYISKYTYNSTIRRVRRIRLVSGPTIVKETPLAAYVYTIEQRDVYLFDMLISDARVPKSFVVDQLIETNNAVLNVMPKSTKEEALRDYNVFVRSEIYRKNMMVKLAVERKRAFDEWAPVALEEWAKDAIARLYTESYADEYMSIQRRARRSLSLNNTDDPETITLLAILHTQPKDALSCKFYWLRKGSKCTGTSDIGQAYTLFPDVLSDRYMEVVKMCKDHDYPVLPVTIPYTLK